MRVRTLRAWPSTALCLAAAFALHATPLFAQTPASRETVHHPYRVRWPIDLAAIGMAGTAWAVGQFFIPSLIAPSCPCDSSQVIPIDRVALHRDDATIGLASDIGIFSLVALPLAADALDVGLSHGSADEFAEDATVLAESIVVSGAFDQIAKLVVHRPRPLVYDRPAGDPALTVADNYLSFYSAHTSTAFAATLSFAWTVWRRHPRSAAGPVLFAAAGVLGTGEGVLRVLAGKHFPTDVIAGAVSGTIVGLGIPWLHTRLVPVNVVVAPVAGGAVGVVGGVF